MRPDMAAAEIPDVAAIPGGRFLMGDDNGPLIERPAHPVEVAPFHCGIVPVTRRQYGGFLAAVGRPAPPSWDDAAFGHPDQPALAVNWFDAVEYCEWLSRVTGARFRLPTEAEREYAARGGVEGLAYPWGNHYPDPATAYHPGSWKAPLPLPCGSPNGFGLYNMGDTVHEWCLDYYDAEYYRVSPRENPQGPAAGVRRVARGGAWRHQVPVSRCAHRTSLPPDRHFTDFGFRVVRE